MIEGTDVAAELPPRDKSTLFIEDGNAIFHILKDIPGSFKKISEKILRMLPVDVDVIFSTDRYNENSVKSMERARRGHSEKLIIHGENTKRPADWKSFLANDENKKQLVNILERTWSTDDFSSQIQGRSVILINEHTATEFTSINGKSTQSIILPRLQSNQEETDTRIIVYCLFARENGYTNVQVRSPDSDIFFILLNYIEHLEGITVFFYTGSSNNRKLINMTGFAEAYTQEYRSALLSLHAFCGCDTTSAFKGRGHQYPIKVLEKRPKFVSSLSALGNSWILSETVLTDLEEFTCAIYGQPRFKSVDSLRLFKVKDKCEAKPASALRNVDLATIPPCKMCLIEHIKRVNYQVAIWKLSHIANPDIPAASDNHGWKNENNIMQPLWTDGHLVPPQMMGKLVDTINENENNDYNENDDDDDDDDVGNMQFYYDDTDIDDDVTL